MGPSRHASFPNELQGIGSVDGKALLCGCGEYLCIWIEGGIEDVNGFGGGDGVSGEIHGCPNRVSLTRLGHTAYIKYNMQIQSNNATKNKKKKDKSN
jgi:hypothetical protein